MSNTPDQPGSPEQPTKIVPWPDDSLFRAAPNPERSGTWLLVDGGQNVIGVVRDGMCAEIICRATHYLNRAIKQHQAEIVPPVDADDNSPRIITPN